MEGTRTARQKSPRMAARNEKPTATVTILRLSVLRAAMTMALVRMTMARTIPSLALLSTGKHTLADQIYLLCMGPWSTGSTKYTHEGNGEGTQYGMGIGSDTRSYDGRLCGTREKREGNYGTSSQTARRSCFCFCGQLPSIHLVGFIVVLSCRWGAVFFCR